MWYAITFIVGMVIGGGLVWWGKNLVIAKLKTEVAKLGG